MIDLGAHININSIKTFFKILDEKKMLKLMHIFIEKGIDVTYVESAEEMSIAMMTQFNEADLIIMCAAVCDHKPKEMWGQKKKKADCERNEKTPIWFLRVVWGLRVILIIWIIWIICILRNA